MFDILLQKRGENIATPSVYIFVFEHEILNKIILIFLLRYIFYFRMTSCVSIYLLAIFLHPGLQNMALSRRGNSEKGILGRQKTPRIAATLLRPLLP